MILPPAPKTYDQTDQANLRTTLEQALGQTHQRRADVELGAKERFILRSPSGLRFSITVSDTGVLAVVAL